MTISFASALGRISLSLGLLALSTPVNAACSLDAGGAKCVAVPAAQQTASRYTVGDAFPVYEANMIIDVDRYGLPPVDGTWRYYAAGADIVRVDARSYQVIEVLPSVRR